MRAISRAEGQALDHYTIERLEIPSLLLMENAALRTISQINLDQRQSFAIFCGMGNNGGDGMAIARGLHALGKKVQVFLVGDKERATEEVKTQYRSLSHLDLDLQWIDTPESITNMVEKISQVNTLIDCLLGTGLSSNVRAPQSIVIEQMNQSRIYILSVDLPSGIDADTGKILGSAVQADQIICLECLKKGLVDNPYIHADIRVVPIGIPMEAKKAVLGEDFFQ